MAGGIQRYRVCVCVFFAPYSFRDRKCSRKNDREEISALRSHPTPWYRPSLHGFHVSRSDTKQSSVWQSVEYLNQCLKVCLILDR